MKCPVCQDSVLRPISVKASDIVLSRCPTCNGVWSDRDKLGRVLGKKALSKMAIPVYAVKVAKACPSCSQPLYEFFYSGSEIEIDACKACDGVWFDYKEINAIKKVEQENTQVICPNCATENSFNKHHISHASCSSCGILFKNRFDGAGNSVTPVAEDSSLSSTSGIDQSSTVDAYSVEAEDDWDNVHDVEKEYKYCQFAIPAMLFIGILFNITNLGAWAQRVWLSMPVHELGHAVTAWFTGYNAIPTLWKTLTFSDSRGLLAPLLLFAGIIYLINYSRQHDSKFGLIWSIGLLIAQFIGTFILSPDTASMLITFGGDGVGLILATLLMSSFYYGKDTNLYNGHLRWGFIAIGAAAFVDIYSVWLRSLYNESNVPYGTTGGQFTDSYKLIEHHGWTFDTLIGRYFMLGNICLIILGVIYFFGLKKAKRMTVLYQSTQ